MLQFIDGEFSPIEPRKSPPFSSSGRSFSGPFVQLEARPKLTRYKLLAHLQARVRTSYGTGPYPHISSDHFGIWHSMLCWEGLADPVGISTARYLALSDLASCDFLRVICSAPRLIAILDVFSKRLYICSRGVTLHCKEETDSYLHQFLNEAGLREGPACHFCRLPRQS
jgi:hypothetical protein